MLSVIFRFDRVIKFGLLTCCGHTRQVTMNHVSCVNHQYDKQLWFNLYLHLTSCHFHFMTSLFCPINKLLWFGTWSLLEWTIIWPDITFITTLSSYSSMLTKRSHGNSNILLCALGILMFINYYCSLLPSSKTNIVTLNFAHLCVLKFSKFKISWLANFLVITQPLSNCLCTQPEMRWAAIH